MAKVVAKVMAEEVVKVVPIVVAKVEVSRHQAIEQLAVEEVVKGEVDGSRGFSGSAEAS